MRTRSDSFRDDAKTDPADVAPSVRWGAGTANEFQLSPENLTLCRELAAGAAWADGRVAAGTQSPQVKRNPLRMWTEN